ncbi:hypothetical protein ES703_81832 [subsurface metagenome]
MLHPVRSDTPEIRVHHCACPNLDPIGGLEHRPEGSTFTPRSPVYGNNLLLPRLDLELLGHLPGVICRTSVGNEDHTPLVFIVLGQTMGHHLDHVGDGPLIIVTRNTHKDIRGFDFFDPF